MLGVFGLVLYSITYPYRIRVCDAVVDQVGLNSASAGLPLLTICYQGFLLSPPRPSGGFTNAPPPLDDITHSGLDYVLCGTIMIVMSRR